MLIISVQKKISTIPSILADRNNAVTELENSQDSITNISLNCGFESQRTFNRAFKDRFKLTPREYRKKIECDKSGYTDKG